MSNQPQKRTGLARWNMRMMQPYPVKTHQLDQEVEPGNQKRKRRHEYKDAYNRFYKQTVETFHEPPADRLLDGFLMLDTARVDHPHEAIRVKLAGEHLGRTEPEDLKYFTNLVSLSLPDNRLNLQDLKPLRSLVELDLMCNKITGVGELSPTDFPHLETLVLSYNRLPADQMQRLSALPRLESLDMSFNDLYTLPEDLSAFKTLTTLMLSSNSFSTDSVLFSPAALFKSLSTLPRLKKLDLSRNKLRGINSEFLTENDFQRLEELDFSYNWVDDQATLMPATHFSGLQIMIVTGNPFALRKDLDQLDLALSSTSGAVLVNQIEDLKKKERIPYPKPVAMIAQDYNAVLKTQLFGVELSKEMGTLALAEFKQQGEAAELFPEEERRNPALPFHDIYTPASVSRLAHSTQNPQKPNVFLTESEATQELAHKDKPKTELSKLDQFRRLAQELLGGRTEYEKPLNVNTAYQQLRHIIQYPLTYQGKDLHGYEKSTATRKNYGAAVQFHPLPPAKQRQLPMQKLQEELESVNQQLALPDLKPPQSA